MQTDKIFLDYIVQAMNLIANNTQSRIDCVNYYDIAAQ